MEKNKGVNINNERLNVFLEIFNKVFHSYTSKLMELGEMDFSDMIIGAANIAQSKEYISPYKYILVDEFQDISHGRSKLIQSLKEQNYSNKLFCVGDDWQSIYRFAGSDVNIMNQYSSIFGFTQIVKLDYTFRFNNKIEEVASKFITKNPLQIKKEILTISKKNEPQVIIYKPKSNDDIVLDNIFKHISQNAGTQKKEILLLGRYNFESDDLPIKKLSEKYPNFKINFKTVHRAKGLEADYVIIVGLRSGRYGFPSQIEDDPILSLVMSSLEAFPNAEERRLFYVALTRTKELVFLVSDIISPSSFVSELVTDKHEIKVFGFDTKQHLCPICKKGIIISKTSQYGNFYSCSNFPLCEYKANLCKHCNNGMMLLSEKGNSEICTNDKCKHQVRICNKCKTGRLVERNGPYGRFFGCTNFSNYGCDGKG